MEDKTTINILLITHFLPPSRTAGTEQYTLGLGKALQAKGYQVYMLCADDWDTGQTYWNGVTEEILDGIPVYRIHLNWLKARNPNRTLYDSWMVEKWLDQFLANNHFDVVHVTSAYSLGVGIFRSVKRAKVPLVFTLTDFWFLCPSVQLVRSDGSLCDGNTTPSQCQTCLMANSNLYQQVDDLHLPDALNRQIWDALSRIPLLSRQRGMRGLLLDIEHRKKVMKETFELPDVVVSPSRTVKDLFAKNTNRTVDLLLHGHDLDWLNTYHGKTKSSRIRIGYLGQIQKNKGIHTLIEAFKKAGLGGRAQLDIWGDLLPSPEYTQTLQTLIGNDTLISLRGRYDRNQLASILAEIDVVVVPSLWYENSPLVIWEAFASTTPVIATNLGGMSEAVTHDLNGLLFEKEDTDDLARQLRRVVDEPGLLEKFTNGIPPVRGFQDEIIELDAIYNRLIAEGIPVIALSEDLPKKARVSSFTNVRE